MPAGQCRASAAYSGGFFPALGTWASRRAWEIYLFFRFVEREGTSAEPHQKQREVVVRRERAGEGRRAAEHVARQLAQGEAAMRDHGLRDAVDSEELVAVVAQLDQAVGKQHQQVAGLDRRRARLVARAAEHAERRSSSLQACRAS